MTSSKITHPKETHPAISQGASESGLYSQTTHGICVSVQPIYLEGQSNPTEHHYVWAYHVRIENQSNETVQLRARYWRITDAFGHVQEVRGAGVIGQQPVLQPGMVFEYTSGTPLAAPSGIMSGQYEMQGDAGSVFTIAIPAFSLDSPYASRRLN